MTVGQCAAGVVGIVLTNVTPDANGFGPSIGVSFNGMDNNFRYFVGYDPRSVTDWSRAEVTVTSVTKAPSGGGSTTAVPFVDGTTYTLDSKMFSQSGVLQGPVKPLTFSSADTGANCPLTASTGGSTESAPAAAPAAGGAASTPTTVAAPSTTPTLVTAANQQLLTAPVGKAKIVIDGKLVDVDLVQAPEDLRRSDPAARTEAQVKALQSVAKQMLSAVQDVAGRGVALPITITNTANGATIAGLVTDPVSGKPLAVPVEDVLLVVNDKLALMVGGADGANNPANIAFDGVIEFGSGGYVAVLAYGLTPGKTGEVVIMSTPKLLQSLKVAADGKLAAQAQVPKDIAPGGHTVVVTVGDQAASLGFRVLPPKKVTANSKSTRSLPATGPDTSMLPLVALVLAAGGVAVLAATRRRKEI
jgi:LPXTG-motif cell wall-anchored protein